MKTKNCILTLLIAFFLGFSCFAQDLIEKSFFDSNKELGSDVIIKKSTIKVEGTKSFKIFEIESPAGGNYYMNAWVSGAELEKFGSGKFIEFELTVNREKYAENFKPFNSNWHNAAYSDPETKEKKTVKLIKGLNEIVFSCIAPAIPDIDFISLSQDKEKSEIPDTKYMQFVNQTEQEMIGRITMPINIPDSLNKLKNGTVLNNPSGNYDHYIEATFKYTYYTYASFTAGQQVFIATNASNFQHVLEMFSYSNPQSYSWITISNTNSLASINVTIPSTGTYMIKVRSWIQSQQGLVNLNVNGQYYYTDCVASGYSGFRCDAPTGAYNYFTSHISGDTRIWLEDNSSFPGRIVAFNDDYIGTGDYYWDLASRINKNFTIPIKGAQFSSYSSYTPTGTCDYYIKCMNSNITSYFPNLKTDDAIQSAPESNEYNCASWGGGRNNLGRYFWASNPPTSTNLSSDWYVSGNFWLSWDKFFGNIPPRWTAAPTYTRTNANETNGEIAMWYNPTSYQYTHFSVRKPANNQPHGYDWESKPGGLMRTFHPRDALTDNSYNGYGQINQYYTRVSKKSYSLEESLALGLTVLQKVNLDEVENATLNYLKATTSAKDVALFDSKMQKLIDKSNTPQLIIHSNPHYIFQTEEFKDLLNYCRNKGKTVWPMLFENAFDENNLDKRDMSIMLINEITPEYINLMQEVKDEWSKNNYTADGAYIAPSPIANTQNFIKKLLVYRNGVNKQSMDNYDSFSVYPNPFKYQTNLTFNIRENNSTVTLKVFDIKGNLLETFIENHTYSAGTQHVNWISNNYKSGIYFFSLTINGKTVNRKFLIE
jgi:hypothetical protein